MDFAPNFKRELTVIFGAE